MNTLHPLATDGQCEDGSINVPCNDLVSNVLSSGNPIDAPSEDSRMGSRHAPATDIRIEAISGEDHKPLVALFREFAEFEKLPDKMVNSVERMADEAEFLHGFTAKNDAGEILGYVTFFFAYYTWTGKSLYMDDLYVRPEYRGRSLGSKLIGEVISFARTNGCHKLRWQVSNWNTPAIGFYRALGTLIDDVERNCDLVIIP